jgi:uncharacterized protein
MENKNAFGNSLLETDGHGDPLHGFYTSWYENGQKCIERIYQMGEVTSVKKWNMNGELDGVCTEWYEDGQKSSVSTFRNGKLHGVCTEWYEDGQKSSVSTFRNGKLHGLKAGWWENPRQIYHEHYYKDGEKDGLQTWWYYGWFGTIKSEQHTYKDGGRIYKKWWLR